MSLFPEENISTREIESWKGFADSFKVLRRQETISWNVTENSGMVFGLYFIVIF